MQILINHIGYEKNQVKKAILKSTHQIKPNQFSLINTETQQTDFIGQIISGGTVTSWKNMFFWILDFSDFIGSGSYRIEVIADQIKIRSEIFLIQENLLVSQTLLPVLNYFKEQRCRGIWDQKDRQISFFGSRKEQVDVHGGWFDAAGDYSKYLSHLSYANYMNPQQIPIVVLNLLYTYDSFRQKQVNDNLVTIMTEAVYGADFLLRMQDKAGYFYMTIFDRWSKDINQREICAYSTQRGIKSDDYQAGYRQGGGITIASLAKISTYSTGGDYLSNQYLEAAIKGFHHLEKNNLSYLNDGKENIIDDYCALAAAVELYKASGDTLFLEAAQKRSKSLISRLSSDQAYSGWWRSDDSGERPYFHAVEAGMPLLMLIRYLEIEDQPEYQQPVISAVKQSLEFELKITHEVNNPFGYPRQYVKSVNGSKKSAFFIPHQNESGYWWQGENARILSLAAAALSAKQYIDNNQELIRQINYYVQDQFNWVFGLNPFDVCMFQGKGRNNPEYHPVYKNADGGICNGITSGFDDEEDITFKPERYRSDIYQNWRWTEQWIPHAAWYLLAVSL